MPQARAREPEPEGEPSGEEDGVIGGIDSQDGADGVLRVMWTAGSLCKAWEENAVLRARGRATHSITKWADAKSKGIASMTSIQHNADALYVLAKLWCPLVVVAKAPSVKLLRAELQSWRQEMHLPDDPVILHLDSWGLRRLFSLVIRRRGASRKRRDTMTEALFEVVSRYWGNGYDVNEVEPEGEDGQVPPVAEVDEYPNPEELSEDDSDQSWRIDLQEPEHEDDMDDDEAVDGVEMEDATIFYEPDNIQCMNDMQLEDMEAHLLQQLRALDLQKTGSFNPDNVETQVELPTPSALPPATSNNEMETSPPSVITPSPRNLFPSLHEVETPEKALPPQEVEVAAANKAPPPQEVEDLILDFQGHASRKDQTAIKRQNKRKAEAKAKPGEAPTKARKGIQEDPVPRGGKSAPSVNESSKPKQEEPPSKRSKASGPAEALDEIWDGAFDRESLDGIWQHHDVASDQWWQWNPETWTWESMLDDTKAEEKDDGEEEEEEAEKEASFARRPAPKLKGRAPYQRWSAIRDAFNQHVAPVVRFPSKHQDRKAHVGSITLSLHASCSCLCTRLDFVPIQNRILSGKLPRSTSRSELMTCRMGLQISLA
ncbi:unnamed protein product [Symbiodinium microadriaticum]|nr:unnamed protein product [Symbiodinium microadriaticum]